MCAMCKMLKGENNDNDNGSSSSASGATVLDGLRKLAMVAGTARLRDEREWLRYAATAAQEQPFMREDNTDDVTAAWATLAKALGDRQPEDLAAMVSAAVIELAFLTKHQRDTSEAASGGTGQYL